MVIFLSKRISHQIGEDYLEYVEGFDKYNKTKMIFLAFYDDCKMEWTIDGITYYPSYSYVVYALHNLGLSSPLSRISTRRNVRHWKEKYEQLPKKKKEVCKKITESIIDEELTKLLKEQVKLAPTKQYISQRKKLNKMDTNSF